MKKLLAIFAMVMVLSPPLIAQGADQTVPNGVMRVEAPVSYFDDIRMAQDIERPDWLGGAEVNIAVVDTGIDTTHPDLNVVGGVDCSPSMELAFGPNVFTTQEVGDSFNRPLIVPEGTPGYQDGMGHGTHVAGIIGAVDNDLGVVGVAPGVNLWAVRVLDSGGSGDASSLLCGLRWIARNHERIHFDAVNMSLGLHATGDTPPLFGPCYVEFEDNPAFVHNPDLIALQTAICDITQQGIPVVVAAGNDDGSASFNFPALLDNVFTVSNMADFDGKPGGLAENTACPEIGGWDDTIWSYLNGSPQQGMSSSNGPDVDFAAPGTCILSTIPGQWGAHGGAYGTATGTSMAAPHVTGLIALYKACHPDATNTEVRKWLNASSETQDAFFGDTDEFHEPIATWGKMGDCA